MNETKSEGGCCGPSEKPVATDCCHPPAKPVEPAEAGHDCCHAGHAVPAGAHIARRLEPGETLYVCPMCPGVESAVPAACPKCGMALESAVPMLAHEDEHANGGHD